MEKINFANIACADFYAWVSGLKRNQSLTFAMRKEIIASQRTELFSILLSAGYFFVLPDYIKLADKEDAKAAIKNTLSHNLKYEFGFGAGKEYLNVNLYNTYQKTITDALAGCPELYYYARDFSGFCGNLNYIFKTAPAEVLDFEARRAVYNKENLNLNCTALFFERGTDEGIQTYLSMLAKILPPRRIAGIFSEKTDICLLKRENKELTRIFINKFPLTRSGQFLLLEVGNKSLARLYHRKHRWTPQALEIYMRKYWNK